MEKDSKNSLEMKKIDPFDLFMLFVGLSILIPVIFFSIYEYKKSIYNLRNDYETDCVEFYKENSYVLDSCKKWENKLENID